MGGKFKPIGSVIRQAINNYLPHGNVVLDVRSVWDECVGPVSARHSLPVGYKNNRLEVHVDDNHWQAELKLYESDIINKLASLVPYTIEKIQWKVVTALPVSPSVKNREKAQIVEPDLKVSPEIRKTIETAVGELEDKDLQQAMRRFFLKIFSLQHNQTNDNEKNQPWE